MEHARELRAAVLYFAENFRDPRFSRAAVDRLMRLAKRLTEENKKYGRKALRAVEER